MGVVSWLSSTVFVRAKKGIAQSPAWKRDWSGGDEREKERRGGLKGGPQEQQGSTPNTGTESES